MLQIFDALYNSKVPSVWLKTYPSLKALGPWTRELLARIEQLARWVEGTYPRLYWLGGFTYPTGFLTAVLQVCALRIVAGLPVVRRSLVCGTWERHQ
jgi:dynein heavy chain